MLVKKIDENSYFKLINHYIDDFDYFSLAKYYDNNSETYLQVIDVILKNLSEDISFLISRKNFDKLYNLFKTNKEIKKIYIDREIHNIVIMDEVIDKMSCDEKTKDRMKNKYDKELLIQKNKLNDLNLDIQTNNPKDNIINPVNWFIYENKVNEFIKDYSKSIFKKTKEIRNFGFSFEKNTLHRIIYNFKIDNRSNELLKNKYLCNWKYPDELEDLCIYKNNRLWLDSVNHEDMYNIYCENEEEFNYLKSIGIEFYKDNYVRESDVIVSDNYIYEEF